MIYDKNKNIVKSMKSNISVDNFIKNQKFFDNNKWKLYLNTIKTKYLISYNFFTFSIGIKENRII